MRPLLTLLLVLITTSPLMAAGAKGRRSPKDRPNVVIIFADDLGYGDLGCYGHPTIQTPHLDRMARAGTRFTSFYVAAPVCTPSRAALLTGRYALRSGMCHDTRRVLFPDSSGGLPASEITLATILKGLGYATACIGKWHLGHLPEFLPSKHGFDSYYGIPYSNDMDRVADPKLKKEIFTDPAIKWWNVPLMRDGKIIERPADQHTLTKRYTEQALKFIEAHKERPFFLYLAHTMPHVPLFASPAFAGRSKRGLYGDVVEELDWSVGQVLELLRNEGIAENTIVIFTSDNGPWLIFGLQGGSAGLLRDGKGSTWEGGVRVPCLMTWPGQIPPASTHSDIASTLDLLPTLTKLAGGKLPADRILDGHDIAPVLFGKGQSPRNTMFFYRDTSLFALRKGPYKAHFVTQDAYGGGKPVKHDPPLLFHLERDPSEKHDIARDHPQIVSELLLERQAHDAKMVAGKNQLEGKVVKTK
jgi:arylsulfatase A-like enzyme